MLRRFQRGFPLPLSRYSFFDHFVLNVLFGKSPSRFTFGHAVEVWQPGGIRRKLDEPPPRQLCSFSVVTHSPGAL